SQTAAQPTVLPPLPSPSQLDYSGGGAVAIEAATPSPELKQDGSSSPATEQPNQRPLPAQQPSPRPLLSPLRWLQIGLALLAVALALGAWAARGRRGNDER